MTWKPRNSACKYCSEQFLRLSPKGLYCSFRCRLWSKVNISSQDECWPWTRAVNTGGYGNIRRNGRTLIATRAAWEMLHGPVPAGMQICHKCDNPLCCNPSHLFMGSNADNQRDMRRKARGSRPPVRFGEANNRATLSAEAVKTIRNAPRVHGMGAKLARQFGIARNTVYRIQSGKARPLD